MITIIKPWGTAIIYGEGGATKWYYFFLIWGPEALAIMKGGGAPKVSPYLERAGGGGGGAKGFRPTVLPYM